METILRLKFLRLVFGLILVLVGLFPIIDAFAIQSSIIRPTNTTPLRIVATAVDKRLESVTNLCSWIAGTANQIVCTDNGDGTITLDFPDAVAITTSLTVPLVQGAGGTGNNLIIYSNSANDGQIILGNATTGLIFDEDDEAATIGGGEIIHTINGSNEKSLFEFHKDGSTAPGGITFHRHSNTDALSGELVFLRSKGDHDTPLVVADGSTLGGIRAAGYDGTDEAEAADIHFEVDGTPGNDDMPGRIIFLTSADGAQTPLEALRIDSNQDTSISGDTWWIGSTAGLPYGSLYLHEATVNVDISGAGSGVYVKITGLTTGLLNNVTNNSDAFNVGVVGVYKVDWQISADSQGSNLTYEVDIFVNGVEQDDGSSRRKFGAAADYGSMSGTGLIDVTDTSHDIDLRMKEVGGAGTDIDIFNLGFNIVQVGGT